MLRGMSWIRMVFLYLQDFLEYHISYVSAQGNRFMNKSVCIQPRLLCAYEFRDDQTNTDSWHIVHTLQQCAPAVKGRNVQLVSYYSVSILSLMSTFTARPLHQIILRQHRALTECTKLFFLHQSSFFPHPSLSFPSSLSSFPFTMPLNLS